MRPPAATQGLRDSGLLDCKFTIDALKRHARRHRRKGRRTETAAVSHQNGTKKTLKNLVKNGPWRASGGSKMNSWSSLGRSGPPCGPKVGPRSAPNRSWERPGSQKQFIEGARGRPRAILESDNTDQGSPWGRFLPPFGGPGAPRSDLFSAFFRN